MRRGPLRPAAAPHGRDKPGASPSRPHDPRRLSDENAPRESIDGHVVQERGEPYFLIVRSSTAATSHVESYGAASTRTPRRSRRRRRPFRGDQTSRNRQGNAMDRSPLQRAAEPRDVLHDRFEPL